MNVITFPYRARTIILSESELSNVEAEIATTVRAVAQDHFRKAVTSQLDIEVAIGDVIEAALFTVSGVDSPQLQPRQFNCLFWTSLFHYADTRRELLRAGRGVA